MTSLKKAYHIQTSRGTHPCQWLEPFCLLNALFFLNKCPVFLSWLHSFSLLFVRHCAWLEASYSATDFIDLLWIRGSCDWIVWLLALYFLVNVKKKEKKKEKRYFRSDAEPPRGNPQSLVCSHHTSVTLAPVIVKGSFQPVMLVWLIPVSSAIPHFCFAFCHNLCLLKHVCCELCWDLSPAEF